MSASFAKVFAGMKDDAQYTLLWSNDCLSLTRVRPICRSGVESLKISSTEIVAGLEAVLQVYLQ